MAREGKGGDRSGGGEFWQWRRATAEQNMGEGGDFFQRGVPMTCPTPRRLIHRKDGAVGLERFERRRRIASACEHEGQASCSKCFEMKSSRRKQEEQDGR